MTKLFELKEKLLEFVSGYEKYLRYIGRFAAALTLFGLINGTIGFWEEIARVPVVLVLAIVCALFSQEVTLFAAGILTLLHLFILSPEVAFVALLFFGILYFIYFRFAPHDTALVVMVPIFCAMGIPYVLPIGTGLLRRGYSVTALICGSLAFYFLEGIYRNINNFQAIVAGASLEGSKMVIAVGQILNNKELYLTVGLFAVATVVVYHIRKTSMQHAWKIAVWVGVLIQVAGFLVGYILLDVTEKMLAVLVGNMLALVSGFVIEFLFMDLNYARIERVQFEDDEYYYVVKAIPKKKMTSSDKKVKAFNEISES